MDLKQSRSFNLGEESGSGEPAWSPDGHLIAVSREEAAEVFNTETGKSISKYKFAGILRFMAFSPDSKSLVVVSSTQKMRKSLMALLSAGAGHPVYWSAFHVAWLTIGKNDGKLKADLPSLKKVYLHTPRFLIEFHEAKNTKDFKETKGI